MRKTLSVLAAAASAGSALGILAALSYSTDLHRISPGNARASGGVLRVFLHRTNSLEGIDRIRNLRDTSAFAADGRGGIEWACETDVQFYAGALVTAHSEHEPDAPSLREILTRIPSDMPLALDLKSSMAAPQAQALLLAELARQRPEELLLCSFDGRLIRSLERRSDAYDTCLFSWHFNPRANHGLRIYEFYSRFVGRLGGFLPEVIETDILAFPWQGLDQKTLAVLLSKNIRVIAGNVDSAEALDHVSRFGAYGIFTDSPELIAAHLPSF